MGEAGIKPIRLEPVYIQSIWAGRRLEKIRKLVQPGIGISREVCAYRGSENRVASGKWKGQSIRDLIRKNHDEIMGDDHSDQLVRVAFMDTDQDLSIQVHPNQAQAEAAGDFEKSESWYILEADEGAYITAGITLKDKNVLRDEVLQNHLEQYLVRIPVKSGDFAMIPAGMVHACGKHMLVLEVGSFGGITYRLYDYGRGRKLDLDKSLEVLDPSMVCSVEHYQKKEYGIVRNVLEHQLFCVDLIDVKGEWDVSKHKGRYQILTCVEGTCEVWNQEESYLLEYTGTIVIPAACGQVHIRGDARLIISYRPK